MLFKKIEKQKIEAQAQNEEGIVKKKGQFKLAPTNSMFERVPVLVNEDTRNTTVKKHFLEDKYSCLEM